MIIGLRLQTSEYTKTYLYTSVTISPLYSSDLLNLPKTILLPFSIVKQAPALFSPLHSGTAPQILSSNFPLSLPSVNDPLYTPLFGCFISGSRLKVVSDLGSFTKQKWPTALTILHAAAVCHSNLYVHPLSSFSINLGGEDYRGNRRVQLKSMSNFKHTAFIHRSNNCN